MRSCRTGEATPDGVQHLLERAQRDSDAARNILRDYVVEQLGERDAVLIVDLCVARGYVEFPSGRCFGAGLGQEFVNITSSWE